MPDMASFHGEPRDLGLETSGKVRPYLVILGMEEPFMYDILNYLFAVLR